MIQSDHLNRLCEIKVEDREVEPPKCLSWSVLFYVRIFGKKCLCHHFAKFVPSITLNQVVVGWCVKRKYLQTGKTHRIGKFDKDTEKTLGI